MLDYDFERSPGYWIVRTANVLVRALNEELAPQGITARQAQALAWLASSGGRMEQRELAARMGVEPPTLVGILERMERDGWVERSACPGDRRKKVVVVRAEAKPVWGRIAECMRRVRRRASRGIPAARLKELNDILSAMRENLGAGGVR